MGEIRALELYSGVGGMHFALKKSHPGAKVVAAVDINPNAVKVYSHNFPEVNVMEKGIEGFSVKMLDKLDFNMVLMSPPCQPFTRIGLQKDIADPRTKSFLHFLSLLPKLSKPPKYILLENVKGFEISEAHKELSDILKVCSYNRQEFLLSPKHLGIPNSRLRYFMLAKRDKFHSDIINKENKIWETLPITLKQILRIQGLISLKTASNIIEDASDPPIKKSKIEESKANSKDPSDDSTTLKSGTDENVVKVHTIEEFLQQDPSEESVVPAKIIQRYLGVVDIVTKYSTNSTCFTKSYTQYAEGTGSLLNIKNVEPETGNSFERHCDNYELRYFTTKEVANLMCFPKHFSFPHDVSRKQRYKLLGNSLNVDVVSYLISLLLLDNGD